MTNLQIAKLYLAANPTANAATIDAAVVDTATATATLATIATTNEAFLHAAYQATFGRTADAEGLAYWGDILTAGTKTQTEVMDSLIAGAEAYTGEGYTKADGTVIIAVESDATLTAEVLATQLVAAQSKAVADAAATGSFGAAAVAIATVTDAATAATAVTTIETAIAAAAEAAANAGETFVLTTSTTGDSFVGTTMNDTFTSAAGTLQGADTILDSSSTDNDVLNAEVTSITADPRVQNVETINVNGKYVTTGIDLESISGTTTLNFNTAIANGTATVDNAASLNALNIVAGANIATLNVEATASGTRDTVYIDANAATAVNVDGDTGTDAFDITVTDGATVTLGLNGGTKNLDTYTLNTTGGDLTLAGDAVAATVTINNTTTALDVVVANGQTLIGDGANSAWNIAGDADVTLTVADDTVAGTVASLSGFALTNAGTGSVTADIADVSFTGVVDLTKFVANVVELSATATGINLLDVNENSIVNLTGDASVATLTLDVGNAEDGTYAAGEGTLIVKVSEDQTTDALITDAGVGTLLLEATPDEVTDTDAGEDGVHEAHITIHEVTLAAETTTVVVQGSADLEIITLTNAVALGNPTVVSASSMTGDLTIGETAANLDVTVVGGAGDDDITVLGNAGNLATESLVYGGAGDDTIAATVTDGNQDEVVKLYGEAGNDTITGSATADIIDGGTDDDTIIATVGVDAIALGTGADTYSKASGTAGIDVISDFVAGTDTIVLTGAGVDIDTTDLEDNLTTNTYEFDGTANFKTTLTDVVATDLSDSIQLGSVNAITGVKSEYDISALADHTGTAAAAAIVAGDKDDIIKDGVTHSGATNDGADDVAHSITLGAGNDILVLTETAVTNTETDTVTVTVTDFTAGEDKVIFEGTAGGNVDVTSVDVTSGVYDIDGAGTFAVTLKNGATALTATDASSMFQLGSTDGALLMADANATVTGGTFDDFITSTTTAGTSLKVNFIDNGGMDTIEDFLVGGDKLTFDSITGITATTGTDASGYTSKLADASDGSIFVFGDATAAHAGTAKVTTFTVDEDAAVTADTILADVADFLDNNIGSGDGENYVAILNDGTTQAYAYLIDADADGIQADNVTLIGTIDASIATAIVSTDIAGA